MSVASSVKLAATSANWDGGVCVDACCLTNGYTCFHKTWAKSERFINYTQNYLLQIYV